MKRIAAAWLHAEDFARWREVDAHFVGSYEIWLRRMEAMIEQLKSRGVNVVKIEVRPEEFLAWARSAGASVDSKGRSAFAAWKFMRQTELH